MKKNVLRTMDIVFKHVFGAEGSTAVLCSLLSAIQTDAGYPAITSVEIRNPFNIRKSENDKLPVVDVRARDEMGRIYTIELQADYQSAFKERSLYYWARAYSSQLSHGEQYETLSPVIGVNVLDYILFPESDRMHTTFTLQSTTTTPLIQLSEDLLLHYLELPKLTAPPSTKLEEWLYYVHSRGKEGAMEDPYILEMLKKDPEIKDAEARYQEFLADEQAWYRYEAQGKKRREI